jgi:hypothetical protein
VCIRTAGRAAARLLKRARMGMENRILSDCVLLICVTFGEVQRRINKGCRIGKKGAPLFCSDRWGKGSGCSKVAAVALSRMGRRELNV